MRNWSIRTRIILGIVAVNLLGLTTVMIYLHESYSGGLDVTEQKSATLAVAAWDTLTQVSDDSMGDPTTREGAANHVEALKAITGAEYGVLIDKSVLDEAAYGTELTAAGQPNNWSERDTYVLLAATSESAAEDMQMSAAPGEIPEIGKIVGVENGACSQMCHDNVEGEGDFWAVRWSKDDKSRGHIVFPINDSAGKAIGIVYALDDISDAANSAKTSMMTTAYVIGGGLIAATVMVILLLNALVFKRLDRMMEHMQDISIRVAGGDFNAHFEPDTSTDEIGRFEQFFARFLDLVTGTLKSLVK